MYLSKKKKQTQKQTQANLLDSKRTQRLTSKVAAQYQTSSLLGTELVTAH